MIASLTSDLYQIVLNVIEEHTSLMSFKEYGYYCNIDNNLDLSPLPDKSIVTFYKTKQEYLYTSEFWRNDHYTGNVEGISTLWHTTQYNTCMANTMLMVGTKTQTDKLFLRRLVCLWIYWYSELTPWTSSTETQTDK